MLKNKSWLLIPIFIFAAGCTTSPKKAETTQPMDTTYESNAGSERQELSMEATAPDAESTAPDKPSKKDIQVSLKNAGFYSGNIDGKIGPKTKKGIEDFQAANNLKVDGKVGPKTWDKLKTYYSSSNLPKS
jgi:peptidoglycan hydrolase-like protein with peptidoglycan-binding domain